MSGFSLVSWNIQAGRGVDGALDLARIVAVLSAPELPDVICLQEVARNMPTVTAGRALDEPALLKGLLPGYKGIFRPAIDRFDRRTSLHEMFGCMIFSRLPVLQVLNHLLPRPSDGKMSMQRQLLEVVVRGPMGPLRISTAHLEFHHAGHRLAQVAHMRDLHRVAFLRDGSGEGQSPVAPGSTYDEGEVAEEALFCGDFNFLPDSPEHAAMIADLAPGIPPLADAWQVLHPGAPHPPTCGMADHVQWPQGPHCRDFVFLTPGLAQRARALDVNLKTEASDHQPVRLELEA